MSRWAVRGAGTGIAALVLLGIAPGVATAAPSAADVAAAQAARDAAAAQVGEVSAQLAAAEAAAAQASHDAQIALQDYEETQAALEAARAAEAAAQAALAQAEAELARGRDEVASFARTSYMQGTTAPGMTALLTSGSPSELMERAALLDAAGSHRVDVVDQLTVLEQQATTAEQEATASAQQAVELEAQASVQLEAAVAQETSAREQTAALADQRAAVEQQLQSAESEVGRLTAEQQAARQAAQRQAQQQAQQQAARPAPSTPSSGGSTPQAQGGGSSAPQGGGSTSTPAPGGNSNPAPVSTTAGAPRGSAVETAIAAARSQRGVMYSWGGGNASGPTKGIGEDSQLVGFDCSGLMQYAYAQAGIQVGGTSRDQYFLFRNRTVARADLQPGDLVFWGTGASYTSIYHVALYLGGGRIIAAPQSGQAVQEMNMYYGSDYFGAVRPTA